MRSETNRTRIEQLMIGLGQAVRSPGRIYFTGGVTAVLMGWRETTLDVDLKADPEPLGFFESLPGLKEALNINIELAAPDQFVPPLPGWQERSRFIAEHGTLSFYHYDFYGQALAKIERDHARDQYDVSKMIESGLVISARLRAFFEEIESQMIRYPAIDVPALKARVLAVAGADRGS